MIRVVAITCAILSSVVASAAADPDASQRPWAAGVSQERQARALEQFTIGNTAFAQADYTSAARSYRQALEDWHHPAIEGNLAIALVHLDKPVEAYAHLENAFAYGEAPFDASVYAQLVATRKLLQRQLARVLVVGDVKHARVFLDGQPLDPAHEHVVEVGAHQLVARRAGYLTFTSQVTALPEQDLEVRVVLVPLDEAGRLRRRWKPWLPWVVAGSGMVVTGIGAGFQLASRSNMDNYELEIARTCPEGCERAALPKVVRDLETRARWQNRLAITSLAIGSAAVVTGVVMLVLNQPQRERVDEAGRRIAITPSLTPEGFGVVTSLSF